MTRTRIAVIGTGYLGRLHARVLTEMPEVEVVGFVERTDSVAAEVSSALKIRRVGSVEDLKGKIDCAVIATNTTVHHAVAKTLLEADCDVLIEKPITASVDEAKDLIALAASRKRLIQVGHVERYNPAIVAAVPFVAHTPRYLEAQRLGVFSGRSLDIDVLLDLMIHDLNLVLSFAPSKAREVRAVGVPVLTENVDMANVRIELENGTVANLTASRVSSDRARKFRIFGGDFYISVDTKEQEAKGYRLSTEGGAKSIVPLEIKVEKKEPLRAELEAFVRCVQTRERPLVSGEDGLAALELALQVAKAIEQSMKGFQNKGAHIASS